MGDTAGEDSSRLQRAQTNIVEQLLRVGVDGTGPWKGAREVADEALAKASDEDEAIKALIRSHLALAGGQGFVTNVGGLITLPVALPANIGAAYLLQTRLIAAIAHVRGHNLQDEHVRTAVILCLLGNVGAEVVKKAGVEVGKRFTNAMITKLPVSVIYKINKRLGFTLLAKYGTKRSVLTLSKGVPLVGGVVGAGVDVAATRAVAGFAKTFFAPDPPPSVVVVEEED